jgi:drug/metabolite transporter (DMT)-like permease
VFVMLTGWLLLGETVNLPGFAGVLLVVAGGWLLNVGHAELRDWRTWAGPLRAIMREPGSRLMLAVAGIYGLTSAGGKAAMRYTGPESFGAFYFAVIGIATLALFSLNDPQIFRRIWRRPGAVLAVGALTAVMVVSHFIALSLVEVAYMISVKRTSLLFGILFGAVFFRESGLGGHLAAGALMVAGVCLIVAF